MRQHLTQDAVAARIPRRLLGKQPDKVLAKRYAIQPSAVRRRRQRLGIAKCPQAHERPLTKPVPRHLVGTASDAEMARRYRVPYIAVRRQRLRLGIPAAPKNGIAWTKAMIADLGEYPDGVVAANWNLNPESVRRKRIALGIEPYAKPTAAGITWTREMIADLGVLSDRHFSRRYRISHNAVSLKRQALGIAAKPTTGDRLRWTKRMQADLGVLADSRIAMKYRLSIAAVKAARERRKIAKPRISTKPWPRALMERLGTEPDPVLAQRYGVTAESIAKRRARLGIPRCRGLPAWVERAKRLFGTQTDDAVGSRHRQAPGMVAYYRRKLGIPASIMRKRSARRRHE